MGYNVFLTGAAGSGKTYLLNQYIRFLKARGVPVGITASTGIAATHLGGFTIHSWAGIGIKSIVSDEELKIIAANKRVAKRLQRTRVLIIDEISMLDAIRLDLVDRVARLVRGSFEPFGGMQVVLCGDFFQLPPVARASEPTPRFAYHSSLWNSINFKICYLDEQYRQEDGEFLGVLNAIRSAAVDGAVRLRLEACRHASLPYKQVTKLYSHNVDVDAQNRRELARLPGKEFRYSMETRGVSSLVEAFKKGCLAPEELAVKKDAAVMFVKNNREKGYVNGTLGTVSGFDELGYPVVKTAHGVEIIADPAVWSVEENGRTLAEIKQVPLRLAWAITIHKSQGMTLDAAEMDLSGAFEKGMGYVALSRVRSLAGIRLLGLNETALEVHPEILAFDSELRARSEETAQEFREMPERVKNKKRDSFLGVFSAPAPRPKTYSLADVRKGHPAAYQKWYPEEEKRLAAGFRDGAAISVLANTLGRQPSGIRSRLRKLGLIE